MKKVNKKLACAIVLGLIMAVPVGGSAAPLEYEMYVMGYNSDIINIVSDSKGGIRLLHKDGATFNGSEINIDVSSKGTVGVMSGGNDVGSPVLNLGEKGSTEKISINVVDTSTANSPDFARGIWAGNEGFSGWKTKNGGKININGNTLTITGYSENGAVYGIHAQNNTTNENDKDKRATININTDNTYINVSTGEKALGNGAAIVAMSQGIINIYSNLEVYADDAIVARGDAIVKVNESGEKNTKLNGDINFNYDEDSSGTKVDADVTVNLTGIESYWNGNAVVSWGSGAIPEDKSKVSGLNLIIADEAQWNPEFVTEINEGDSGTTAIAINSLTSNDGVINLSNMKDQKLNIEKLQGRALLVNLASAENKMAITGSINDDTKLTAAATSAYAEELIQNGIENGLEQVASQITDETDDSGREKIATTNAMLAATSVTGEITAEVDKTTGKIIESSVREGINEYNQAISNMASIGLMAWRAENDDMNKRLGELRNSNGEHGVWARMVRGENEYGSQSIKNVYNTYQLGYDEKLSTNEHWTVGAAISYTDGQSSFNGGSGENTSTGIAMYGSYLGDNGTFVDLIAKYARLDNEFDVVGGAGSGDYSTNGYSFSAEYGKRNQLANDFYFEPQIELTYGRVADVDYMTSNSVKVCQDAMDSLVGRVGFAAGKNIKNGNIYVRASYLYDFDGETNVNFTKNKVTRNFSEDLGGGWFEFGIGTNINLSDATYLYFDVEKTTGGEVDTNWQWNAGVRYSF